MEIGLDKKEIYRRNFKGCSDKEIIERTEEFRNLVYVFVEEVSQELGVRPNHIYFRKDEDQMGKL